METSTKVILSVLGVIAIGVVIYLVTKPKEISKPIANTGNGNVLNLGFVTPASSASGTIPSDFGFNGTNTNGEQVVNGMTQEQYLAAGYSEADVALLFS